MAYKVYFFLLYKKINSTYKPKLADSVVSCNCDLMDGSGMLTPTLVIDSSVVDDPTSYNYCYINAFHRYYFIRNWRYSLGLWQCETEVDVLASWRDELREQYLYIARSANNQNLSIADTTYPMLAAPPLHYKQSVPNLFNTSYADGYFVAGIVNTDTNTVGAISYYCFTAAQFRSLLAALMGDVDYYGVTDISAELTKILANPFQYIASCRWLPIAPPTGTTTVYSVTVGWWTYNVEAKRLPANAIYETTYNIPVNIHPQIGRGDYLGRAPYSEYYLIFPPFGAFNLPPEKIFNSGTLYFTVSVDYLTGISVLYINDGQGQLVSRVEGMVGATIPLAQLAPNVENILNSPIFSLGENPPHAADLSHTTKLDNVVKETAQTSELVTALLDIGTGIANAYLSTLCPPQITGNNQGISGGRFDIELHAWFTTIADESIQERGRPYCQMDYLRNMRGFTMCGESDITIPCTKTENEAIRGYLISGFFME